MGGAATAGGRMECAGTAGSPVERAWTARGRVGRSARAVGPPAPPAVPMFAYGRAPQPPNRPRSKVFLIVGVATLVVAGAVTATFLAVGGSSAPVGFNDPARLSADVSSEMNLTAAERFATSW